MRKWYIGVLILTLSLCIVAGVESTTKLASSKLYTEATAPEVSADEAGPSAAPAPAEALCIRHPSEGARLPALSSTFVFGQADPEGKLTINGQPVPVHPGGGYLAMVRLSSGTFTITAELTRGTTTCTTVRHITVAALPQPAPVAPLTIESLAPDKDWEVLPGDEVPVTAAASPGMKAFFTVDRVGGKFPMTETGPGIYRGVCLIGAGDRLKKSKIRMTLHDPKNGKRTTRISGSTLSLFPGTVPAVAEVTARNAKLTAGPMLTGDDPGTYLLFPPAGTRLRITGRRGDALRVRLTKTRDVWVDRSMVRLLPAGTPPPSATAGSISVEATDKRTRTVRVPLGARVPFDIAADMEGKYIDVSFFGTASRTDWIVYRSSGVVDQVKWFQDGDTYRLRAALVPGSWWGYDARYEGTSFVLELRTPPPPSATPLEGLTVCVDPGHSPDSGAVGPTGLAEKDANLALANVLREKLAAKGARVVMTREGSEGAALYDRPKIAWKAGADMIVSVHNNALPDGENPLVKNGYGVYYYHPSSFPLARAVHDAYRTAVGSGTAFGLRDDGLYYGDLVLTRTTQMPAVLTESAYIILPQEEADLKEVPFRAACAESIVKGIERYVREVRPPLPAQKKTAHKRKKVRHS